MNLRIHAFSIIINVPNRFYASLEQDWPVTCEIYAGKHHCRASSSFWLVSALAGTFRTKRTHHWIRNGQFRGSGLLLLLFSFFFAGFKSQNWPVNILGGPCLNLIWIDHLVDVLIFNIFLSIPLTKNKHSTSGNGESSTTFET